MKHIYVLHNSTYGYVESHYNLYNNQGFPNLKSAMEKALEEVKETGGNIDIILKQFKSDENGNYEEIKDTDILKLNGKKILKAEQVVSKTFSKINF